MQPEEFTNFKEMLKEKLPVTFRVNPGLKNHEALVAMFSNPNFIKDMAIEHAEDEKTEAVGTKHTEHVGKTQLKTATLDFDALKFECKKWYPSQLVWELEMPKDLFRKN